MNTFLHSAAIAAAAAALTLAMSGTNPRGVATPSNTAVIEVSVPADAKVWFDDSPTEQTGPERSFVSPPLTPGKTYSYVVTAQWRGPDGKDVVRKQPVSVRANESSSVEFVPRANPPTTTRPNPPTTTRPNPVTTQDTRGGYSSGDYRGGRGNFSGYYRVGNVIINGRRWGDIGYRYSHADLIRW